MIHLISAMAATTLAMGVAGRCALVGRLVWSSIAVVLMAVIAGARDLDVATDMLLYGNGMFERITQARTFEAAVGIAAEEVQDPEVGYVWLNFMVAQVSHDVHLFYFVLALFCGAVVAAAVNLLRSYGPTWLMWLTYLCTAYVDSFNLLRQAPALALALLGVALTVRRYPRWGFVVGAAGALFHLTAVIFLPMWLATLVVCRSRRPHKTVIWVVLVTAIASAGASALLDLLGGALSDTKYVYYLEETEHGGIALSVETLYRLIPIVLAVGLAIRHYRDEERDSASHQPRPHAIDRRVTSAGHRLAIVTEPRAEVSARGGDRSVHVLIALSALLAIELLILPVRELAFGLYRVPMYFGFSRIIGYGVIVGAVVHRRVSTRVGAAVFVVGYFLLVTIGRTGIEYQSAILDAWMTS